MRFSTVENLPSIDPERDHYDMGVFASGFEERSTYLASRMVAKNFSKVVVAGFPDGLDELSRQENDRFFQQWSGQKVEIVDGYSDEYFFKIFSSASIQDSGVYRILIDYSVMTRTWYAAMLTWMRYAEVPIRVEIDFVYSCGIYMSEYAPLSIADIETVPGFEGISGGFRRTTAIFGLGYDKYATLAVYDRLEPDSIYCCIARQSASDANAEKVILENEVVLEAATKVVELPLMNVSEAVRLMCDHVLSIERDTHIVVVPMGPKTHILVTFLVALRLPWLTCVHPRGERITPVQVKASGEISVTRVVFSPERQE